MTQQREELKTNEEWQKKLATDRLQIKYVNDKKLTRMARNSYIINRCWELTDNEHNGDTQDKRYCNFINDVLKQIRSRRGKPDYCYKDYQIYDLLRFEPLLNTMLINDDGTVYFEVWLDKK